MVPELFEPSCDVVVCLVLADVINEKCAYRASVVGGCNGSVALLASSIPDLRLDGLCVDLDRPSCKFDTNRRLGIEIEFVSRESA